MKLSDYVIEFLVNEKVIAERLRITDLLNIDEYDTKDNMSGRVLIGVLRR